jgi:hypothetical protein
VSPSSSLGSWCRDGAIGPVDTIHKSARRIATDVPGHGRDGGGAGGESGVRPTREKLDGIDTSDQAIHIRIEGTMLAYCGASLRSRAGYIPEAEVTPTAWCPACERAWGIA